MICSFGRWFIFTCQGADSRAKALNTHCESPLWARMFEGFQVVNHKKIRSPKK
jgi:hypothetical protein